MQRCAKLVWNAGIMVRVYLFEHEINGHFDMKRLLALSANIIRRLRTADKIITPKKSSVASCDRWPHLTYCSQIRQFMALQLIMNSSRYHPYQHVSLTNRFEWSLALYAQSKAKGLLSILNIGTAMKPCQAGTRLHKNDRRLTKSILDVCG